MFKFVDELKVRKHISVMMIIVVQLEHGDALLPDVDQGKERVYDG